MTGGGAKEEKQCDCVMHQTGLGIKRTVPEDWVSFEKFVRKKKQPTKKLISRKKKPLPQKKKKAKCINRRRR